MAETTPALARTHPFADPEQLRELTAGHVSVRPFVAMVVVRAASGSAAARAAAEQLGVDLPTRSNTWVATGSGKVLWLGPDEWLVLDEHAAPWDLEASLRTRLAPVGGAATDVSAQRVVLRLNGPHARDVLRSGTSLDVDPRSFPPGSCAQVSLSQAGVVLLALSERGDDFEVLVRTSFAGYLAAWLADACLEFRPLG
ncbi:sarcosine oxidase subunit gamma family protein [Kineococcus sp. NPDC059986]|jgi:sarcosine oxidase subunit gamma|uniref:sarcosine oxidase subunit gamma n=1 Tax=Kineococcus sp. NPDC059986 TaxID=3155538 RepID=UPI00344B4A72